MHAFGYSKIVYLKKYTKVICPSDIKNERPLAFTTSCFVYLFIHLFIYLFISNKPKLTWKMTFQEHTVLMDGFHAKYEILFGF